MPHEEANSSTSSDEKRSGSSPNISADCAPSFFDDPSFFEDVVLGASSETGTLESEAATSERQRLIKQATQISQQLRVRLQELDRRESSMLALSAAFEAEQRAWRLICRQHQEGFDAREARLQEREAEIESKARELGAWEQAIANQSQVDQANLEKREQKLVAREQRFSQQLKNTEHKNAERHQALSQAEEKLNQSSASIEQKTKSIQEREKALLERLRKVELADRELRRVNHAVADFLEQASQQTLDPLELRGSELSVSASDTDVVGDHLRSLQNQGSELVELLEVIRLDVINAQKDRLIAAELHQHLCDVCEPETLEQQASELRHRLKGSLGNVGKIVEQFESQANQATQLVAQQIRERESRDTQVVAEAQRRLDSIRKAWLQLDLPHDLTGPHWNSKARGGRESVSGLGQAQDGQGQ